ncbi:high affinity copper uptake protein 1-like [Thrips palmi]|uniref:Copper transport protein n=1 Tax=Thrips palmi TaxID=161013 RepID=A0A6P8YF21_THRPL|nr:high affinity copper uptake protein 1-like [Thrips palmi]
MDTGVTKAMDMGGGGMDMGGTTMDMGGGGMDMGGGGGDMYMMIMWFHAGMNEYVLFDFWRVKDGASLAYSMVILFLAAFLYEGLKYTRESLYVKHNHKHGNSQTSSVELNGHHQETSWIRGMLRPLHLVQTGLHAVQFLLSYLLMLVFMTYNVWLCLAVLLGATFGFFVFGWKKEKAVDMTEHCH